MADRMRCSNCGKAHPNVVWFNGKWYCPGACNVTRRPRSEAAAEMRELFAQIEDGLAAKDSK